MISLREKAQPRLKPSDIIFIIIILLLDIGESYSLYK